MENWERKYWLLWQTFYKCFLKPKDAWRKNFYTVYRLSYLDLHIRIHIQKKLIIILFDMQKRHVVYFIHFFFFFFLRKENLVESGKEGRFRSHSSETNIRSNTLRTPLTWSLSSGGNEIMVEMKFHISEESSFWWEKKIKMEVISYSFTWDFNSVEKKRKLYSNLNPKTLFESGERDLHLQIMRMYSDFTF